MPVRKARQKGLNREQERLFNFFSNKKVLPNELGRQQFHTWNCIGIEPADPDMYYTQLREGRKWYFWLQEELYQDYGTEEWPGWSALVNDWKDNLWVFRHLINWYKRETFEELVKRVRGF